jgi:hypothetical protein
MELLEDDLDALRARMRKAFAASLPTSPVDGSLFGERACAEYLSPR